MMLVDLVVGMALCPGGLVCINSFCVCEVGRLTSAVGMFALTKCDELPMVAIDQKPLGFSQNIAA